MEGVEEGRERSISWIFFFFFDDLCSVRGDVQFAHTFLPLVRKAKIASLSGGVTLAAAFNYTRSRRSRRLCQVTNTMKEGEPTNQCNPFISKIHEFFCPQTPHQPLSRIANYN